MKTLLFILLSSFALASGMIFIISLILMSDPHVPKDFIRDVSIGTLTLCLAFAVEALLFSGPLPGPGENK